MMISPADEGWLLVGGCIEGGRAGMGDEVVERGGYTFPNLSHTHALMWSSDYLVSCQEDPLLFNFLLF